MVPILAPGAHKFIQAVSVNNYGLRILRNFCDMVGLVKMRNKDFKVFEILF